MLPATTALVAYNESGWRIGETHHNSKISDERVDEIRDRHECFGWSYTRIARYYAMSYSTVQSICQYRRRGQRAERWKRAAVKN